MHLPVYPSPPFSTRSRIPIPSVRREHARRRMLVYYASMLSDMCGQGNGRASTHTSEEGLPLEILERPLRPWLRWRLCRVATTVSRCVVHVIVGWAEHSQRSQSEEGHLVSRVRPLVPWSCGQRLLPTATTVLYW